MLLLIAFPRHHSLYLIVEHSFLITIKPRLVFSLFFNIIQDNNFYCCVSALQNWTLGKH